MAVKTATKGATTRQAFVSACTDEVRESWSRYLGGQFWAYWIAYVSFYLDVCDWTPPGDIADRHRAYADAQMSACWWWPHQEFVTVSERPNRLERDDQGRLHSATGPAIGFRDGWKLYAVHGVQVDAQVIEAPHTLKPEQITNQPNAEVRRVMMDMFGPGNYILGIGADPLDTMPDFPAPGTARLWRAEQRDDEPLVMLEMVNATAEPDGTFKRYWERVPERGGTNHEHGGRHPVIRRVKQALAWRVGIPEAEYILAAES